MSIAFHGASAVAILVVLVLLANFHAKIQILRRWACPKAAGVLVGKPVEILAGYARAVGVAFEVDDGVETPVARVSLSQVAGLHFSGGIAQIRIIKDSKPVLSFKIRSFSDTIGQDKRQIEQEFSNTFRVEILPY